MKKGIILFFIALMPLAADAQRIKERWKSYRTELHFGIGASNFLGELGGANQVGTDYFKDLEMSTTRPAVSFGLRYKLLQWFAVNPQFTYGQVSGRDALTEEAFRNYRNLNFKSNIYELAVNFEGHFLREQMGSRYRLRGVKGARGFEISAYGFVGIGAFYFNPKGSFEGEWHELQPLGTEGQGLTASRDPYKRVQVVIPFGIGFKYNFSRDLGIGLQYGIRKTFTDYIDDVSKTYYDNAIILTERGDIASALADKSDGTFPNITAAGQQRGDPNDKDAYMFAVISINYKLRTGRSNFPIF
ncbi:MAG: outer membrane beta-barrel protein [Bacteroidia bacterium]|nr:outer membrane beta-barrel protein [Bacteroidia bacterium]